MGILTSMALQEEKRYRRRSMQPESMVEAAVILGEPERRPNTHVPLPKFSSRAASLNEARRGKGKVTEADVTTQQTSILRTGIALDDFQAKEARELTVNSGEYITDLEPDSWYGQSEKGIRGGFAGTYVQIIDENDFSKGAIATRDCQYHNFREGDFLSDLEPQPDGSYYGRNERGIRGKFPGNYARLIDHKDITKGAFALHDYRFQNFRKGEHITNLRLTWWRGVNPRGEIGCVPVKLVEIVPDETQPPVPRKDSRASNKSKRSTNPKISVDPGIEPMTINIPCIAPNGKKWIHTIENSVDILVEDLRLMAARHLNVTDPNRVRVYLDDFALHHDTWRIPTEQLAEMCRSGTKIYTKRSDHLVLRYGEDVHLLRFEAGSIEKGILFMSRVRDEAAIVMGKGFRTYPVASMRLHYMGAELSRNVPVSQTVRQERLTVGAEVICEFLQREDRKQYVRDCDREVLERGVAPKTQACVVCGDEKIKDEFPARIAAKCKHDVHTCLDCLQSWISSQLDTTAWNRLHCPECKHTLKHGDVRNYAADEVFLRFVFLPYMNETESGADPEQIRQTSNPRPPLHHAKFPLVHQPRRLRRWCHSRTRPRHPTNSLRM
jgi:hypothetical protein